jgi:ribosomal protein S15P/S13E
MSDIKNKYLVNSLVGDYQKLTQDIMIYENELDTRDSKWQTIGGIKNPNFKEERKKEFINNKISDLTNQRNKIWNFLSIQFKNNTIIRDKNFKQLQILIKDINNVSNDIKNKKEEMQSGQGFLGKQKRQYEILNYNKSKDKELIYLHVMGLISLLICCGLMISVLLEKIPIKTMFIVSGGILSLYLLYLIKVVYLDNVNQSSRYNNKFNFNNPNKTKLEDEESLDSSNNSGCQGNTNKPEFKPENDEVLKKIKQHANVNEGSCLKK